MPVFNGAATLARALDSIAVGEELPDEIIVVDDGSRDESPAILAQYRSRLPSMRVLTLDQNRGLVAALNAGLNAAQSRYVARLDADDEWLPGHVASLRQHIACANGAKLLSTSYVLTGMGQDRTLHVRSDIGGFVRDNFIAHSSVCIDREALLRLGGYQAELFEDYATWLGLIERPGDYYAIDQATVRIHMLPTSLSRMALGKSLRARYRLQCEAYRRYARYMAPQARLGYRMFLSACRIRLCFV
jgi:glycosyltransferase involved in cell wall biosynthesis